MSLPALIFDKVFQQFRDLAAATIVADMGEKPAVHLVPLSLIPAEAVAALIAYYGPSIVYPPVGNVLSQGVPIDALAQMVVTERARHGLFMTPRENYRHVASRSFRETWILDTLNVLEGKKKESPPVAEKASDESYLLEVFGPPGEQAIATAEPTKPKRGEHLIADPALIQSLLEDIKQRCEKDGLRRTLLEQLKNRPIRQVLPATRRHLKALDSLQQDFPHFAEVIGHLRTELRLLIATRSPLAFQPLLVHGAPGVGKTEFARRVAEVLGLKFLNIPVGSVSGSFLLRGSHRTWGTSAPGMLAQEVCRLPDRCGLYVLLDEIDKLQEAGRNHPIEPVLLDLLEPRQSAAFQDEYLALPLNLTPLLSCIATANNPSRISAPLKSRLQIFEVPVPSMEQMPAVVRSIDRQLRSERPGLSRVFAPLSDDALRAVQTAPARDVCAILNCAYGLALEGARTRSRMHMSAEDVRRAIAGRPRSKPATMNGQDDDVEMLVAMVPVKIRGDGTPPAGSTLH